MQEDIHYLYKITNLINGKLYIGVTKDPKHRKECHFSKANEDRLVNKAVAKYGKENILFEIICIGSKQYIYDLEIEAIKAYNSDANTGHGYNICSGGFKGGAGNLGRKHITKSDDVPYYVSGFWFPNKRTSLRSLNWGVGKFNSRKKKDILGSIVDVTVKNGPQKFTYVSGFWFPSKKFALEYLNITSSVYQTRKVDETLGNVTVAERKSNSTALKVPNYYRGFWFPDLDIASLIFKKTPESIRQQINRGVFEEDIKIKNKKPSRNYVAEGKEFTTLGEASAELGIPLTTIKNRISKGVPNYGRTYSTQGQ